MQSLSPVNKNSLAALGFMTQGCAKYSTIEGFNGYAKDDKREALGATRNRRRRGMVNHLLVIAISLAVTNIRKIKAFETQRNQKTYGPDRPPTGRRKPYDQLRPFGKWPPGQVPGSPAA